MLDLAVQPDGRILIAGGFTSVGIKARSRVARLNPDGSLDETFDPGPGPNDLVKALALHPEGSVSIAGQFTEFSSEPARYLARLRSDGTRPVLRVSRQAAPGEWRVELLGNAGGTYVIESSVDLATWAVEATNTLRSTSWQWDAANLDLTGRRFFRARRVSE